MLKVLPIVLVRNVTTECSCSNEVDRTFGTSLIYNRDIKDPRIETWGTPQLVVLVIELTICQIVLNPVVRNPPDTTMTKFLKQDWMVEPTQQGESPNETKKRGIAPKANQQFYTVHLALAKLLQLLLKKRHCYQRKDCGTVYFKSCSLILNFHRMHKTFTLQILKISRKNVWMIYFC